MPQTEQCSTKKKEKEEADAAAREEFLARQSRRYVADSFGGSLPRFLAAFTAKEKLSGEEVEALRQLIEQSGEG